MINLELELARVIKNVQSRFVKGFFIIKEEADDLRKKVTRPIYSKKFKRFY